MKSAVLVFPGSNCDRDMAVALESVTGHKPTLVWHKETCLPDVDLIALPGGFSYGDYLRCGAIAARSPIIPALIEKAHKGVPVLGVCNGFQTLTEIGLLPGALIRNRDLTFICRDVALSVERTDTAFTNAYAAEQTIRIPIAHHDGNYVADEPTVKALNANGQILFRYADENLNGSVDNIAGITDSRGRILGMMPHPERAIDAALGGTDGRGIFESLVNHMASA